MQGVDTRLNKAYSTHMTNFLEAAEQHIATHFPQYVQDAGSGLGTTPLQFVYGESEIVVYKTWGKVFQYTNADDKNGIIIVVEGN